MKFVKNLINLPLTVLFSLTLNIGINQIVRAETPEKAPSELIEVMTKIDLAANNKDLETLQTYLSQQFSTKDGLDYKSFTNLLEKTWKNYPNLNYKTTLTSWELKNNQLQAETVTEITGSFQTKERKFNLTSTISSRQYFENGKLIRQEILKERTDLTSGEMPPEVEVKLPETVKPGEEFNFDVIVKEPLGSDILLGGAKEENVSNNKYFNPLDMELSLLSAGGIFKLVNAPQSSADGCETKSTCDRRYSALLIRAEGIRLINQRVRVEK